MDNTGLLIADVIVDDAGVTETTRRLRAGVGSVGAGFGGTVAEAFRLPPASTNDVLTVFDTALTAPAAVEWER